MDRAGRRQLWWLFCSVILGHLIAASEKKWEKNKIIFFVCVRERDFWKVMRYSYNISTISLSQCWWCNWLLSCWALQAGELTTYPTQCDFDYCVAYRHFVNLWSLVEQIYIVKDLPLSSWLILPCTKQHPSDTFIIKSIYLISFPSLWSPPL